MLILPVVFASRIVIRTSVIVWRYETILHLGLCLAFSNIGINVLIAYVLNLSTRFKGLNHNTAFLPVSSFVLLFIFTAPSSEKNWSNDDCNSALENFFWRFVFINYERLSCMFSFRDIFFHYQQSIPCHNR